MRAAGRPCVGFPLPQETSYWDARRGEAEDQQYDVAEAGWTFRHEDRLDAVPDFSRHLTRVIVDFERKLVETLLVAFQPARIEMPFDETRIEKGSPSLSSGQVGHMPPHRLELVISIGETLVFERTLAGHGSHMVEPGHAPAHIGEFHVQ